MFFRSIVFWRVMRRSLWQFLHSGVGSAYTETRITYTQITRALYIRDDSSRTSNAERFERRNTWFLLWSVLYEYSVKERGTLRSKREREREWEKVRFVSGLGLYLGSTAAFIICCIASALASFSFSSTMYHQRRLRNTELLQHEYINIYTPYTPYTNTPAKIQSAYTRNTITVRIVRLSIVLYFYPRCIAWISRINGSRTNARLFGGFEPIGVIPTVRSFSNLLFVYSFYCYPRVVSYKRKETWRTYIDPAYGFFSVHYVYVYIPRY